jgi:hypothetical protein
MARWRRLHRGRNQLGSHKPRCPKEGARQSRVSWLSGLISLYNSPMPLARLTPLLKIVSAIAIAGGFSPELHAKDNFVWKVDRALDCDQISAAKPDGSEGDYVLYKCPMKLGPDMWLIYHEGTRRSIGFGKRENFAAQEFSINGGDWPVV